MDSKNIENPQITQITQIEDDIICGRLQIKSFTTESQRTLKRKNIKIPSLRPQRLCGEFFFKFMPVCSII